MARTSRRKHNEGSLSRGYLDGRAILKKLDEVNKNVISAISYALADGADIVVEDAKSRCPVHTGELRDSIKAEEVADIDGIKDGLAYTITANATNAKGIAYGQFMEFSPTRGHPFLYPALEAHEDEIRRNIAEEVRDAIERGKTHGHGAA